MSRLSGTRLSGTELSGPTQSGPDQYRTEQSGYSTPATPETGESEETKSGAGISGPDKSRTAKSETGKSGTGNPETHQPATGQSTTGQGMGQFMSQSTNGVRKFRHQNYTIHMKDDGFDYLAIFAQLETIQASAVMFTVWNKRHQVFKFDFQGRTFVAKIDPEEPKYFENKLWELITGPFYSTQMKAVNKAIRNGCAVIPDIFLVAEKKEKGIRCESIVIMEYVPGVSLCTYDGDYAAYKTRVLDAMAELHRYGLALGDANCGNFVIHGERCIILDLSWHGLALLGQAKDRLILERVYGWHLPEQNLPQKLASAYIRLKRSIQHALSARKRERPNR